MSFTPNTTPSPAPTPPPQLVVPPSATPPIKVLEVKTDPRVLVPFLLIVVGVVVAAAMHKIDVPIAALILGALGVPSVVGVKTMPALVSALVAELQKQIASMPPAAVTSVVPPPPPLPTGTEAQAGLTTPVPDVLPTIVTPITEKDAKP